MDVEAKTAVITGAGQEVGRRMAIALAERGANVGLLDRDAEHLTETAAACRWAGVRVAVALGDSGDARSRDAGLATIERHLGPVDILVDCDRALVAGRRGVHLTCNRHTGAGQGDTRTVVTIAPGTKRGAAISADDVVEAAIWLIDRPSHLWIDGIDLQSRPSTMTGAA